MYTYDAIGSYERVGYGCQGSGKELIQPVLDNQLKAASPLVLPQQVGPTAARPPSAPCRACVWRQCSEGCAGGFGMFGRGGSAGQVPLQRWPPTSCIGMCQTAQRWALCALWRRQALRHTPPGSSLLPAKARLRPTLV